MVIFSILFCLSLMFLATEGQDGGFTVYNAIGLCLLAVVAILIMRSRHGGKD